MTLTDMITPNRPRGSGSESSSRGGMEEPRSWPGARIMEKFTRSPSVTIPIPGHTNIQFHTDRVRAAPALTTSLAGMIGNTAIMLGVAGLLVPRAVARAAGLSFDKTTMRTVFGARELATGMGLFHGPSGVHWLWMRVAGDVLDIAVLRAANYPGNPRRRNAKRALAFVLAVTALDVIAAARLSNVKRNCR